MRRTCINTFQICRYLVVPSETGWPPNKAGIARLLFKYFNEKVHCPIDKVQSLTSVEVVLKIR